jgi:hypothetical protein
MSSSQGLYLNAGKVKVKLSLCSNYVMKAYGELDIQIHIFLTSALVGGEWSASCLCGFTPREMYPGTHWLGGWVGLKYGLDN